MGTIRGKITNMFSKLYFLMRIFHYIIKLAASKILYHNRFGKKLIRFNCCFFLIVLTLVFSFFYTSKWIMYVSSRHVWLVNLCLVCLSEIWKVHETAFSLGILSMQGSRATTKHRVTRRGSRKRLKVSKKAV